MIVSDDYVVNSWNERTRHAYEHPFRNGMRKGENTMGKQNDFSCSKCSAVWRKSEGTNC